MQHPLAVYVAMDRLQAMVQGSVPPDYAQGAVLFADVSGFTPLTAALAQDLGPQRGAEELTLYLNRVYGALIDAIHRYRGSVISFAGDAVTCWFEKDKGARATACALAMQEILKSFSDTGNAVGQTPISLGVKIAVMAGSARRFVVGNPQIQVLDVMAGALLDRMAVAEQQLNRGEVVVGAEVLGSLGNRVQIDSWRLTPQGENFALIKGLTETVPEEPWPDLPELEAASVNPWLLPVLSQRVERGEAMLLAELRSAIPCFLQFSGIDYDGDPEAGAKLDAFVRWVQTILAHYEGYLTQLTMGDKGSCLYILFGAPISHEDDGERAISAALELRNPPPELNFIKEIRIGMSQGPVYIGTYGGPSRQTYGGLGREVNLASRLMGRAEPGQILVSERIVNSAGGYSFERLGEWSFKGVPLPMAVFAASGGQRRRIGHLLHGYAAAPMVGREAERAILSGLLQDLKEKRSGCCLIEGEAGIGKSRLIDDLQDQARTLGVVTLSGAGDAVEHTTAYYAWRPVFRALLGGDEVAESREALQVELADYVVDDPYMQERLPLLNAVLPLNLPENELTGQMGGELRAENTRDLLVRFLQRGLKETMSLALVIEDVHWLDSASWALLAAVQQTVQPLLLVVGLRPLTAPFPAEYETLRKADGVRHLKLDVLPANDALALVCQRLGAKELAPELSQLIQEKAEGHPFFSEELAYALRDTSLVEVDAQGVARFSAAAGDGVGLVFPDTIQGVITSRIDRLPPAHQATVKVASVIGRVFAFRTLRDIFPVETDRMQLPDYLEKLSGLDLMSLFQSPPPDLKYIFKHSITQEVAYNLMLYTQRRELHQRVAAWYEEVFRDDLEAFYPLLAYHWLKAEDSDRALLYLEKAGVQALRNYANEEAIEFFSQALELVDKKGLTIESARRGRWELQLGEAYVNRSLYNEGREHLSRGLALLGYPVSKADSKTTLGLIGALGQQVGYRMRPVDSSRVTPAERELLRMVSHAYEKLAETLFSKNDMVGVLHASFMMLNLAEKVGPSEELSRGFATVGTMMGFVPWHSQARAYFERAQMVAEQAEDLSARAYGALMGVMYYGGVGNWALVDELSKTALELSTQLGDHHMWNMAMFFLIEFKYCQGSFSEAMKLTDEFYLSARQRKDVLYEFYTLCRKTEGLCCLGNLDEARRYVGDIESLIARYPYLLNERIMPIFYAQQMNVFSKAFDAEALFKAAEDFSRFTAKVTSFDSTSLLTLASSTYAYLILWESGYSVDRTAVVSKAACKRLDKYALTYSIAKPWSWLFKGTQAWISGQQDKALTLWSKAVSSAQGLKMPYVEGLACYEMGRHRKDADPQRRADLERAAGIFERLGAKYDFQKVQDLLERRQV